MRARGANPPGRAPNRWVAEIEAVGPCAGVRVSRRLLDERALDFDGLVFEGCLQRELAPF
eukprot:5754464-Pyramimonas_sp.AAC.1